MPRVYMVMKDFAEATTPRKLFSTVPRLSFYDAFDEIKKDLPDHASVVFNRSRSRVFVDVYPFCGPGPAGGTVITEEPTHLSYEIFPEHQSALIWRIKGYHHFDSQDPSQRKHSGVGAALMASQYPLWQKLGVQSLAVSWTSSQGFYEKLGFRPVEHLPELPDRKPPFYQLMRLDFENPDQKAQFLHTTGKARPLTDIHLDL